MKLRVISVIVTVAMLLLILSGCKPTLNNKPSSSKNSSLSSKTSLSSSSSSSDGSEISSDWGVEETDDDDEYDYSRTPFDPSLLSSASSNDTAQVEGLLNASIVGINKYNFYNEVKYKAPENADFTINATAYGVIANDRKDDTVALQAAIAFAKAQPVEKTKKIVLPAGDLDFVEGFNSIDNKFGIVIQDLSNLSVVGQNTNIYFYNASLGYKGINLKNCKNFLLTNVNIDWGNLPYVSGEVIAFNATERTATIQVNKGYTVDENTTVTEYLEYDKDSNLPREPGNFLYNHNDVKSIPGVKYIGNNKLELTFGTQVTQAPIGTRVAIAKSMHFSETFVVQSCENAKFETINLYASPGMAFLAQSNTNLYFNRFNAILKPGTDRLITGTADILHLKNTAGEIIITNSTFENSHDDAVNVGGHYLRIQEISGNRIRAISPMGMWGTFKPTVGDIYEASDISTLIVKKSLTITKVEDSNDGYWITVKESTDGLVLNNALANITRTPKLIFKNNLVRNKRNRGLLCQTRNVLIENNAFSNVMQGPISLLSEVNIFNESTAPKNVTIRNNKFVNNNQYGEADIGAAAYGPGFSIGSPLAMSVFVIENNFMAYSKNTAISLKGVSDIKVNGNLIYNPATNPSDGSNNSAILLENVDILTLKDNKIFGGTKFGYRSVFIAGGVNAKNITLENNIGINREDIFGVEKIIDIDKSNATINVLDNSLSDWQDVGTSVSMGAVSDVNRKEVDLTSVPREDFLQITKLLWKDDGIYFSFSVKDESVQFLSNEWYLGDGMEMFLTTDTQSYGETGTVSLFNDDTFQFFMRPISYGGILFHEPRTSAQVFAQKDKFKLNFWTDSEGYKGEGFIPFSVMTGVKTAIIGGKAIAMSINFGDSDAGNGDINPLEKFMTFSTVRHLTTGNKMIPANMTKFLFKQ